MADFSATSIEVQGVYDYVFSMLGAPIISVELSASNVATAFNSSIEDYSSYITDWAIKNNIANILGLPSAQDFTLRFSFESFSFENAISKTYSQQAGVGGTVPFYKSFFNIVPGQQHYVISGDIRISELLWQETPAVMRYLVDPYTDVHWTQTEFGWAYMGNSFLYVTPVFYTIQAAQMAEIRDRVRKSEFSHKILPYWGPSGETWNEVILYPTPGSSYDGIKVWYFYQNNSDLNYYSGQQKNSIVNNPGTVKYDEISYSAFNSSAQRWIKRYTLASCKEILGRTRGKFKELPIPNAVASLDADSLLAEAAAEKELLVQSLMDQLNSMSINEAIIGSAEKNKAINETLSFSPLGIIIG
jgi:hypothetical protein